ncbi:MAG: hypothetical protein UY81_C0009G0007 [Candidatus Giovannonibacteria bacterium GW2011_GWA2_53_7]|uniref:Uncharacterized protein n=1 Tax=Candidatus Giovannonibacteria bacterium GW2011_GWA2_53_7 TaxID=1618650 RepID=A0A0G2A7M1_9BACT|nr:MAG: hypothetical protein UY81_C0009G0007 [Candidatus Giovannonibacteria bacterium GW2011_GWA2_53_7]
MLQFNLRRVFAEVRHLPHFPCHGFHHTDDNKNEKSDGSNEPDDLSQNRNDVTNPQKNPCNRNDQSLLPMELGISRVFFKKKRNKTENTKITNGCDEFVFFDVLLRGRFVQFPELPLQHHVLPVWEFP